MTLSKTSLFIPCAFIMGFQRFLCLIIFIINYKLIGVLGTKFGF